MEVPITRTEIRSSVSSVLLSWMGMANGDDGKRVELIDYSDRTVTITGTFGVGGQVTIQGSNNGTDWMTLTDAQGNAIVKSAASMECIVEVPYYIRPYITGGDGTTSIDVQILCRRTGK